MTGYDGLPWTGAISMVRRVPGVAVPDIFDEVNEDLRAERAQRLLQRYGVLLVAAAVLLVLGVGAWQAWRWRENDTRATVAAAFLTAMHDAAPAAPGGTPPASPATAQAMQTFAAMGAEGPSGYRTLARLREAALKASGGDLPGALALWDQVSADETADRELRSVADLLWIQHQVDAGDPAAVEGRLAPLLAPASPWRPLAREAQAWLKLRTGDKAAAAAILRELVALPTAPNGLRARASGLLARLGEPPTADAPEKQG